MADMESIPEAITRAVASSDSLPEIQYTAVAIPNWVSVLVYGAAKLGKTTLVHETTPAPKLTLATEDGETQGLQSIQDLNVPFVEIRTWPVFELVHAELMRVKGKCQYRGLDLENVIVDSYSCCGHLWWERALGQLGWKEVGLGRGRAGLQPYSYVAEKGRQATKRLLDLKANVIVVAREGVAESGMGTDDFKSVPCIELPGAKLFNELPGSFDAVVRLRRVNGQNVFVTSEEGGAIAGIRVPKGFKVPLYIKPHIGDVIALVKGDRSALDRLSLKNEKGEKTDAPPPAKNVRLPGRG